MLTDHDDPLNLFERMPSLGMQMASVVGKPERGGFMSTRAIQLSIVVGSLIVLLGTVGPGAAYAETEPRCFAETNFCIAGRLREFWEHNGGLPVFGLPLGPQSEARLAPQR